GRRTPTRSESRPMKGEMSATAAAWGARTMPVALDERPFTSTTSSGTSMSTERLTNMATGATERAATEVRFRKRPRGTKGCATRLLRQTRAAAATNATKSDPHEEKAVKPSV